MADVLIYPRMQIAFGAGDLIDAQNIKYSRTNNGKQVHTIRRKGAGKTLGVEETTVTFDLAISEEGAERDFAEAVRAGTISQIRLKLPGRTIIVNGSFDGEDIEGPLDAEIKQSMTFTGKTEEGGA